MENNNNNEIIKELQKENNNLKESYRQLSSLQNLSSKIFSLVNKHISLHEMITGILKEIQLETNYSAVGLRLKNGNDYPYFEQNGFTADFLLTENTLTVKDKDGSICKDENGNILLECTCGLVITGKIDTSNSLFTKAGSFWTNNSYPLLNLTPEQEPRLNPRNKCVHCGFGSVAIIPIRADNEIVGILQLNEKKKEAFTNDIILFFEGICSVIGAALIRTQAEDLLRKSEEQYKDLSKQFELILDHIPALVFYKDKNNNFVRVNKYLADAHKTTKDKLEGKNLNEIYSLKDATNYHNDDLSVINSGNAKLNIVEHWETENGLKWVSTSKIPFVNENNEITGIIGISIDVTQLKNAESELKIKNSKLYKIIAEKDKFYSIISHDLKSPFNALIGFSEMLSQNVSNREFEKIEEFAQIILQTSRRTFDLLTNLLEWSQSQTGKIKYNPENIDITEILNNIMQLFTNIAEQKSITIINKLNSSIFVFADKKMISTIIRNLVSNAIKYTMPGGIVIISTILKQNNLVISVSDNGVGIPKNDIDKLFKIEDSYSTTGTNNEKGTGLGLILCQEFIDKHNGKIWVESEEKKGSTFFFTIPNNEQ